MQGTLALYHLGELTVKWYVYKCIDTSDNDLYKKRCTKKTDPATIIKAEHMLPLSQWISQNAFKEFIKIIYSKKYHQNT